jgi:hypothetical protein
LHFIKQKNRKIAKVAKLKNQQIATKPAGALWGTIQKHQKPIKMQKSPKLQKLQKQGVALWGTMGHYGALSKNIKNQ